MDIAGATGLDAAVADSFQASIMHKGTNKGFVVSAAGALAGAPAGASIELHSVNAGSQHRERRIAGAGIFSPVADLQRQR
jgi:hypothetical protein